MKGIAYMNKFQETEYVRGVAKGLIEAVGGIVSDKAIEGVISVFRGIEQGLNSNWEEFLAKRTNDTLTQDNVSCECGTKIRVIRTRETVKVQII